MRKMKIYLDTSVISFYFAGDAPEKMAITRKFFDQELASGNYEIYKHLVKLKTKRAVKIMAVREGFKEVEILTPQEVIADED